MNKWLEKFKERVEYQKSMDNTWMDCIEIIDLDRLIAIAEAAKLLRIAVAGYQNDHDHLGGDHIGTGRSWLLMTRARDTLATALKENL